MQALTRLLVLSLPLLLATKALADDKATLAAKPWKVVKSEEAPAGTTFKFTAAGAVTVSIPIDGKIHEMSGTYTLSGTMLTMKIMHNGQERLDVRTIKKLTDSAMVLEDKNRKLEELAR